MQVRIYTKDLIPLTTLLVGDVESVSYSVEINDHGQASFTVRADSTKISSAILRMYNKVKIFENGVCKFYGIIGDASYTLETVTIKCLSVSYQLQNRSLGGSFVASGTLSAIVNQMLTTANSSGFTGISAGTIDANLGTINKTYTGGDSFMYILEDLINEQAQWYIDPDGLLHVRDVIGADLSSKVVLKYDTRFVANSTISDFDIKESSRSILTQILAKSDAYTALVSDTNLIDTYGLVEDTKSYQYIGTLGQLNSTASKDLKGSTYTPQITLIPTMQESFKVGDILGIKLYNRLIDISTSYQVISMDVDFIGLQKRISIKLNEKQKNLIDVLKKQQERIKLLENN